MTIDSKHFVTFLGAFSSVILPLKQIRSVRIMALKSAYSILLYSSLLICGLAILCFGKIRPVGASIFIPQQENFKMTLLDDIMQHIWLQ